MTFDDCVVFNRKLDDEAGIGVSNTVVPLEVGSGFRNAKRKMKWWRLARSG